MCDYKKTVLLARIEIVESFLRGGKDCVIKMKIQENL